jgi:uncharacterized ferredoxin-like protein
MTEMDDTLLRCARFMDLSARTAPKSAGQDYIITTVLDKGRTDEVGRMMMELGESRGQPMFVRDGKSVMASGAMLLVGVKEAAAVGLDCGACGYATCADLSAAYKEAAAGRASGAAPGGGGDEGHDEAFPPRFSGPVCAFRLLDMGIALGSAAKTASVHNADNRIMYRAGIVARDMGLIEADCVMAIPLSATGKSVFFDR